MGMDLSGAGGYFRFSITSWGHVLQLAHDHGWEPAGTEPPMITVYEPDGTVDEEGTRLHREAEEDWDGGYFWNSYQSVIDEDAANIADALERALDDVPDQPTVGMEAASRTHDLPGVGKIAVVGSEQSEYLTPLDWFSGEGKQQIREFIAYCRVGGFSIG
jgi:hypothetical protein